MGLLSPESVRTEPWTYESTPGQLVTTPSYRIFTTTTNERLLSRFPSFMEGALAHYASAFVPLDRPAAPMELYLMGTRPQWERLTRRFMGADAGAYLRIERGGFSARGRAILWDIGQRDTFAIAAHEGWHQFTQSTFREPLPVALEEGLATYLEGFRWTGAGRLQARFLPWANFERFYQLREAAANDRLMGVDELLRTAPQDLVGGSNEAALDYYAQVWALSHFLMEGEGGIHREALLALIQDAATGRLGSRITRQLGSRAAGVHASRRRGVDVLAVYTGKPSVMLDAPYREFVARVVRVGAVEKISRGQSPVAE
jgi:hypothetical protein